MKKLLALLLCAALAVSFGACAKTPVPAPSAESSTAAPESTAPPTEETAAEPSYFWDVNAEWDYFHGLLSEYQTKSVMELLEEAFTNGCFDRWGTSGDPSDYSIWGLVRLSEEYPVLRFLLGWQHAIQEIRENGPALVEKYLAMDEPPVGLRGLADTIYLIFCPDMQYPEALYALPQPQANEEKQADLWGQETERDVFAEIAAQYVQYSDIELLEMAFYEGAFKEWGVSSAFESYGIWGLVRRAEQCPPLKALLGRQSAVMSIREYGPALVERLAALDAAGELDDVPILSMWGISDSVYLIFCPDLPRPKDRYL